MVPAELLLGLVLLMVGFVFFCNGMTLLGKTGAKEVGVLNLAVGIIISIAAWQLHAIGFTGATALISVFALIYFMVAGIFVHGFDGKGLGWFCLFGTVVFAWYGYHFYGAGLVYLGLFCFSWAVLVFFAFTALALGKATATLTAYLFLVESIITLLIPGMLLLTEKWHPFGGVPGG